MKIKALFPLYFTTIILLAGCADLDDFLFNEDASIDQYYFDEYNGDVNPELPDGEFEIEEDLIHPVTFYSGDNNHKIHAVYIGERGRINLDTVILYCHGNRDHMDFYWNRAKLLAHVGGKHRYGVFMFDYRGFGLSKGKPDEQGLYEDVYAAAEWLADNGLESDRLVVYGFSLGSAPATHLSVYPENLRPNWLILESPFASSEVMVQDGTGLVIPAGFFTTHQINNANKIKNAEQPLLWLHGRADKFLRIDSHGEEVFRNHGGERSFGVRVEGADHDGVPERLGFEEYLGVVERFLGE